MRIKYGVIALLLFVGPLSLLLWLGTPKGYISLFPEDYAGWVCIHHDVSNAPPLPEQDGYLVIKIPEDGILKTSSQLRTDPRLDEYYYYKDDQIIKAEGLKVGGGGTIQYKIGGPIISHFWVSRNEARDRELYIKGEEHDISNMPCGPFSNNIEGSR